jgi:hypothetical protein
MKTIILNSFLILVLSVSVSAQKVFEWAEYGLAFDLADDFQETVNTGEEFSAKGDGMSVSIFPFQDATIDDADITAYTIAAAAALNLDAVDDVNFININGFKGGYAEVVSEGNKVFIMGLIDPDSDVNFFIIISI